MTLGIIAACLPTLKSLSSALSTFFSDLHFNLKAWRRPCTTNHPTNTYRPCASLGPSNKKHHHYHPTIRRYFTFPTFNLPPRRHDYFHRHHNTGGGYLNRYYDSGSNVTFDLAAPPRSWSHNRTSSRLSTMTNFSLPFDGMHTCPQAQTLEMCDVTADVGALGIGYAVSVTSGSSTAPREDASRAKNVEVIMGEEESGRGMNAVGGLQAKEIGIMRTMTTEITIS